MAHIPSIDDFGHMMWCNCIVHMVHSFQFSFVSLSYCES
jgi:hypothetical protein